MIKIKKIVICVVSFNVKLNCLIFYDSFLVICLIFFRLAKKFGLELVRKEKFEDYYERRKSEGRSLLDKMQTFEV